ncbi:ankyrin-3-like [Corticium candelabrum]|uniref:ankyrin-3-like n=1 Tax=Corticium candelabrum TaxID=121492 RepID=UPI002E25CBDD|nr:ankyrin-3-like [Corticium candelabrum]
MAASNLIEMSIDDTLFDAVMNKDIPKAVLAIDNGADVNTVTRHYVWAILGRYGTGLYGVPSALQVACSVGSIELCDLLIRKEANVNYQEKLVVTAGKLDQHCVVRYRHRTEKKHARLSSFSIKLNADKWNVEKRIDIVCDIAKALHYASNGGHVSIMKRLISTGCNKNIKNYCGETALHVAGNVEVVDYLLIIGLNIEDRTKAHYTPFLMACCNGRLPVVQRLIQSKCNKAATTNVVRKNVAAVWESNGTRDLRVMTMADETFVSVFAQLCSLVPRLSCSILVLCLYDNSKHEIIVIRAPDKTSTRESWDEAMSADGRTAVNVANNVKVVDYLLSIGLNTEDHDKDGYTPFLRACHIGDLPKKTLVKAESQITYSMIYSI